MAHTKIFIWNKQLNESEVGEDKTTMTDDPTNLKSNPGLTLTDIMHDDTQLEHFKVCKSKSSAIQWLTKCVYLLYRHFLENSLHCKT